MLKRLNCHGIRLFKANYTEKNDDWLATEETNNATEAENLKAPPWKDTIK